MNDVCRLMWWRSEASVLLTPTSSRSQIEQRDQRVRTFLTADQRRQLTALLRRGTVPSRDEQAAHHERLAHALERQQRDAARKVRVRSSSNIAAETLTRRSVAPSCRDPAIGYCQGTPLRNEIEARDANRLAEATVATGAISRMKSKGRLS
jgi:hypothetical protein